MKTPNIIMTGLLHVVLLVVLGVAALYCAALTFVFYRHIDGMLGAIGSASESKVREMAIAVASTSFSSGVFTSMLLAFLTRIY